MNKDIIWSIGFIGGYFEFIYKADYATVEVRECHKNGTNRLMNTVVVDYPSIGEDELALFANAYISAMRSGEMLNGKDMKSVRSDIA